MKYPQLQSLIPAGEHFDESAIINEGGYLSINHLAAIEERLANNQAAFDAVKLDLDNQKALVDSLTEKQNTSAQKITDQANKIAELNDQVAELGKEASGTGSSAAAIVDENANTEVPSYLSASNPANEWADKHMRTKK